MGKSKYTSVDELPDLSQEQVHQYDPASKSVKTYNSVDELPDLLKKKVGTLDFEKSSMASGNGLQGGESTTLPQEEGIPTISMYETKDGDAIRTDDIFGLVNKKSQLKEAVIPRVSGSTGGASVSFSADPEKLKESKELGEFIKSQGYDPDELENDFNGIPEDAFKIEGLSKNEILSDYKENPQLYKRKIGTIKWQAPLLDNMREAGVSYKSIDDAIRNIFAPDNSYANVRRNVKDIYKAIEQYGGDNKDEMLKNFTIDISKAYAKGGDEVDKVMQDERAKYLNENQLIGLQFLEDTDPRKAQGFSQLLIDPSLIQGDDNVKRGWEEKAKKLEQIGLGIQQSAVQEDINQLTRKYKDGREVTPQDAENMAALELKKESLTNKSKELNVKYPGAADSEIHSSIVDIIGRNPYTNAVEYPFVKLGHEVENTAEGVWSLASEPFRSEESSKLHQLAIAGEKGFSDIFLNIPSKDQILKSYSTEITPKLKAVVDPIINNPDLSDQEKYAQLYNALKQNPGEYARVPLKGSKVNINPASLWYSVSDLGATLLPFMAFVTLTGGGATAGAARKLASQFTAAAATSFNTVYADAVKEGVPNPFGYALRVTAINSAAMAGAGTAGEIKKMLGTKTAIGELVNSMSDDAINALLNKKGTSAIKDFGKVIGKSFLEGAKTGAKFETLMAGAEIANAVIDKEKINPKEMAKKGLVGTLNFTLFGTGTGAKSQYRKLNELEGGSLLKASENPTDYLNEAQRQLSEKEITPEQYNQISENIKDAATVGKRIEYIDNDGKPLSEKKKAELLVEKLREYKLQESVRGDVPTQFREKVQKEIEKVKENVEKIYEPEQEDTRTEIEMPNEVEGVGAGVKFEKPTPEQQLKDIKEGNVVTFEYKNESEVPEVFKEHISSKGKINGNPYVRVTISKSLSDYYLKNALKEKQQSGKDVVVDKASNVGGDVVQNSEYKGVSGTTSVNVKEKDGIIKATFTGTRSDKPNATIGASGYRYGGRAVKETLSDFEKDYGVKVDEIIDGVDIAEITVLEERAEVNPREGVGTGQSVTLRIRDTDGNIINDVNIVVNKRKFTEQSQSKQESGGKAPVTKPEGKSDVVPPTEQQSGKDVVVDEGVTFENAKEGDVVNDNGVSVTVVGKTKSRGGADVIEVKQNPKTKEQIKKDALQNVFNRVASEYKNLKPTWKDIEENHPAEVRAEIEKLTALENSRTATYTIDKEGWDENVKSETTTPILETKTEEVVVDNRVSVKEPESVTVEEVMPNETEYEKAAKNIFNEDKGTLSQKVKLVQSKVQQAIYAGIKKWGSKKGYHGEEFGTQSEREIDVPNYRTKDERYETNPEYRKDFEEYRALTREARDLHTMMDDISKDLSGEPISKLKKRIGSIAFNFHTSSDAIKTLDAKEADLIIGELNKRGAEIKPEDIFDMYEGVEASENQLQQMRNNVAEITDIIKNKGLKKQQKQISEQSLSTKPEPVKNEEAKAIEVPVTKKQGVEATVPEGTEPVVERTTETTTPILETKTEETVVDKGAEPPKPPTETVEVGKDDLAAKKKRLLNRLVGAKFASEESKVEMRKDGLDYIPKSQSEAESIAKEVLDSEGIDSAVLLARANEFGGDVNTLIQTEALNRLKELEDKASTPEEKQSYAVKFAELGIELDKWLRKKGQSISALKYFYKKSPLGIEMIERAKRKEEFEGWAKKKEQSWEEFFNELIKEPEFEKVFKENVSAELKKERAEARKERVAKVDKFFDEAIDKFKGGATYSTIIPPKVITLALEGMKKAYHAGEAVAKIIQDAVDFISKEIGTDSWDKDKFRKEWQPKLSEKGKKILSDEEVKLKILDKFRKKLKGLSEAEREQIIKKSFAKLVENDALDYADFRKIIAEVTGRGELTDAEAKYIRELVNKTNEVDNASKKLREERTQEAFTKYRAAELNAAKAQRELNILLSTKPEIINRLNSIMQLNTLGIPALVNNPIYNLVNQSFLRFPIATVNTMIDYGIAAMAKAMGRDYVRETDVIAAQKEFFNKLGFGAKESLTQFITGLNRMDYTQKEIKGQNIRPFHALKDLSKWVQGKKNLTKSQIFDKALQGTVGIPAEIVARALNLGDKPMRFGAEGAQASVFAKALGLKDIDYKLFIEFPREEAYRKFKAEGLSDAEAAKKADYIRDSIVKEGERATFQQDNMLNDLLNSVFQSKVFGGASSGVGNFVKSLTISPYIKIPSNAYWSYYNIINPEIAILQSMVYGSKAALKNKNPNLKFGIDKDNSSAAKDLREARYWFGHAVVGIATRAVVASMVSNGIFRSSNTKDDTKKEREGEQFYEQQGSININKLWAWLKGKNPDEVEDGLLVNNRWFGHWGTVGNTIAKQYEDATPEQKEAKKNFWDAAFGGMELETLKELDQGVFANTAAIAGALENDFGLRRYGANVVNMFTNIIHPAAFAQQSRAELPYYTKTKADSFLEELGNSMLARSSWARKLTGKYPPSKITPWGDEANKKDTPLMRMFGISRDNRDNFGQPVYDDYRKTENTKFLPPSIKPEINKVKLNSEETKRLEQLVGKARKQLVAPYVNDMAVFEGSKKKYSELSDEEKIKNLERLYEKGFDFGKSQFLIEYPKYKKTEDNTESKNEKREKKAESKLFQNALNRKQVNF